MVRVSQEPHAEDEVREGSPGWRLDVGEVTWIAAFLWFVSLFAEMLEIVDVPWRLTFHLWPILCCVLALSHIIEVQLHRMVDDEEQAKGFWSSMLILLFFGFVLLIFGWTMFP